MFKNPRIINIEQVIQKKESRMTKKEEQTKVLRRQRDAIFDKLLTLQKSMEKLGDTTAQGVLNQLQERASQLEAEFGDVHKALLEVVEENDVELERKEHAQFDANIFAVKLAIGELQVTRIEEKYVGQPDNNLPILSIPRFSGKYEDWTSFQDLFMAVVDKSNIQLEKKFQYLKTNVEGEAFELIKELSITAENYQAAWKILKKQYENPKFIIGQQISQLVRLPALNGGNPSEIKAMIVKSSSCLNALKALKYEMNDMASALLAESMSEKLDRQLRERWEIEKPGDKVAEWNDMINFLNKHMRVQEHLALNRTRTGDVEKNKIKEFIPRNRALVTTNSSCSLCGEEHGIYNCAAFIAMTIQDREAKVKQLQLCFNCLGTSNHNARGCTSSYVCKQCGKLHHTLLHRASANKNFANVSLPIMNKKNETLLATVTLYVYDNNRNRHLCRAILDTASQNNFMTIELANKLQLEGPTVEVRTSGLNATTTVTTCKEVTVMIESRVTEWKGFVDTMVIDLVTESLPSKSLDTSDWTMPEHIQLADPDFATSKPVDMLLGADIFFGTLMGQIHQLNEVTMLETVFGWIVGGNNNERCGHHNMLSRVMKATVGESCWQRATQGDPKPKSN